VLVLTKRSADESNTKYAQGGIAAVLSSADSFAAHIQDTLEAGAGLCHERTVEICVTEGPARVRRLEEIGARFDKAEPGHDVDADLDLHLEGGHSARRVAHAADMTGREVERALLDAVKRSPRVRILEDHCAIDLITLAKYGGPDVCAGAYALDEESGQVVTILARAVVLASGGAGKVYLYTTNPDVATGDGVAMAYRAGAEIANMEFYQFHPTCLFHPQAKRFLLTEAMRGEGAILRRLDGTAFMKSHDPRGDLAPRDVVARAVDFEMKKTGAEHVWLDITDKKPAFVRERFPNIYEECLRWGIDISTQPIPVVPAAHFMCGGITTNFEGRTTIPGLWAIGECASTGLHGANRLASEFAARGARLRAPRGRGAEGCRPQQALARRPRVGDGQRRAERRGRRHHAELGRAAASHVELRRHRALGQAPAPRRTAHRAAAGGDRRVLLEVLRHARPARAAQHRHGRAAHRRVCREPPREPRPALHHRLSGHRSEAGARHGGQARGRRAPAVMHPGPRRSPLQGPMR
jgi:L-aspartate oxidase